MDYNKPETVVGALIEAGAHKSNLPIINMLLKGILSGGLLGVATSLAFTAAMQSKIPIIGAMLFPVGFVMLYLLGLELATGNFALLPLVIFARRVGWAGVMRNWFWVYLGNLIGSLIYAALLWAVLTVCGQASASGSVADSIVAIATLKTVHYAAYGGYGWLAAFIKGVLCNLMVTMAAVMFMVSKSTTAKILAMWLPIMTFFGQGFEHSIVNMFVIPAGIMLGAKISVSEWWMLNEIPATLGNIAGAILFTALPLYVLYKPKDMLIDSSEPPSRSPADALRL